MRKLLLFVGVGSFVIGTAILLYDFYFFHCYGDDMNNVAVVQQGKTFDWPTGERPLYAFFPAWFYGVAFALVAAAILTVRAFLPRNRCTTEIISTVRTGH